MDERTTPTRRASENARPVNTKILFIEPPKARDHDFPLLPTIHLCPDDEDLYWGMYDKRPVLYWDRLHLNCRWFHLMTAITPSGRHYRFTRRNPDGTWDRASDQPVWASVGRWKGKNRYYKPGRLQHDKETCEQCEAVRRAKREGRIGRRLAWPRSRRS